MGRLRVVETRVQGGVVDLRLSIPSTMPLGRLEKVVEDQTLQRQLRVDGFGWPEAAELLLPDRDRSKFRVLRLFYRDLPSPDSLPARWELPHRDGPILGFGRSGPVVWPMEKKPHLRIGGGTGSGKGLFQRFLIGQAVRAGWFVMVLDGQGAPEHTVWAPLPNVCYEQFDLSDPAGSFRVFLRQLEVLREVAAERQRVCTAHGVDGWARLVELDEGLALAHPRVLLVVDEGDATVGKNPSDDAATKLVRQQISRGLVEAFRQWRKWGMQLSYADQISYADTWLGRGALAQSGWFCWLGSAPEDFRKMTAQSSAAWPDYPDEPCRGVTGSTLSSRSPEEFIVPKLFMPDAVRLVGRLLRDQEGVGG